MPVWVGWELCEGGGFAEVVEREGGEDGDDDVVLVDGGELAVVQGGSRELGPYMSEVCVKSLPERELLGIVIDSGVYRGIGGGDVLILEPGEEFPNITYTLGPTYGLVNIFSTSGLWEFVPVGFP